MKKEIKVIQNNIAYLQEKKNQIAKRFDYTVGAKEVRKLIGEMIEINTDIRELEELIAPLI